MYKSALKHSTELLYKEFSKERKSNNTFVLFEYTVRKWLVHDGKSIH